MTIRNKLLTLFALLLSSLLLVQTWLFYQYTDEVAEKFGEAAFLVSKNTASVLVHNQYKFQEKHTYRYRENGQTITKTIIIPQNQQISLRLHDDTKDDIIRVTGGSSEFQIPIPRTPLENSITNLKSTMLWITLLLFSVVIVIAAVVTFNMLKPLTALNKTAQKISMGEFGAKVALENSHYPNDFKQTITQFNIMSDALVDLSQQKQQKQELEHFREISDISRGLAHNLRNPLNTLMLSIDQIYQTSLTNDSQQHHASFQLKSLAQQQIQRIDNWLKSFMLLMEQGLSASQESTSDIMNQAVQQSLMDKPKAHVHQDITDSLLIHCVKTEIVMVLETLLNNALEATANTDNPDVRIQVTDKNTQVEFTVSDNGVGINPEIRNHLFNPYVTDKTYGTGMGLYIAQRIIKHRYNGKIIIEAQQPTGTLVTVLIDKERYHDES